MKDEIPAVIAEFLREQGFDVFYEYGCTIFINLPEEYISLVVWYNPTPSISVSRTTIKNAIGHPSTLIDLSDPDSLNQIATIVKRMIS